MNERGRDSRLLAPSGRCSDRENSHDRVFTPGGLALAAAGLLLRQDLWGQDASAGRGLGRLTVLGSLYVAAGGAFTEDGRPTPPQEPAVADVVDSTCELLVRNLNGDVALEPGEAARKLEELTQDTTADSVEIQRLLATVHGMSIRS